MGSSYSGPHRWPISVNAVVHKELGVFPPPIPHLFRAGTYISTGDANGMIRVWDVRCLRRCSTAVMEHRVPAVDDRMAFGGVFWRLQPFYTFVGWPQPFD